MNRSADFANILSFTSKAFRLRAVFEISPFGEKIDDLNFAGRRPLPCSFAAFPSVGRGRPTFGQPGKTMETFFVTKVSAMNCTTVAANG
jgi:hypothetical protein